MTWHDRAIARSIPVPYGVVLTGPGTKEDGSSSRVVEFLGEKESRVIVDCLHTDRLALVRLNYTDFQIPAGFKPSPQFCGGD